LCNFDFYLSVIARLNDMSLSGSYDVIYSRITVTCALWVAQWYNRLLSTIYAAQSQTSKSWKAAIIFQIWNMILELYTLAIQCRRREVAAIMSLWFTFRCHQPVAFLRRSRILLISLWLLSSVYPRCCLKFKITGLFSSFSCLVPYRRCTARYYICQVWSKWWIFYVLSFDETLKCAPKTDSYTSC